ncbi:MAG: ABC transporter ATP-binding protein [Rhodospirillales bacterium]|nr:ABC transporter ATP-binding protein [Rhodospirillales bacterium]
MSEVRLEGVTKRYTPAASAAVDDVSLTLTDGGFAVLLGPTGAGKTTTLRLVAGLEKADSGRIFIDDRDVTQEAPSTRDVTFVFQQYSLYPHLTVYDNLAFPLRSPARRQSKSEVEKRVTRVAEMLRIPHKLKNKATQLSGGEMQRVAIGRALVRSPSVYLMDEPLSSLDAKLRAELRLELKRIQHDLGATILYVTHDQVEAMTMASRIGVLSEGKLVQFGTPRQIYEDPDSIYVAERLGTPQINLLPVDLLPSGAILPGTARIGARTEHLRIEADGSGVEGRVVRIEHLGDQSHLHLEVAGHALTALADAHTPLAEGAAIRLTLSEPLCFGSDGRRLRA